MTLMTRIARRWSRLGSAGRMAVYPCFGCVRWTDDNEPDTTRVWIHATDFSKRETQDVGGDVEHDSNGKVWFRPRRLRKHQFFLCTVCAWLFDNDSVFLERMAQKASSKAGGS